MEDISMREKNRKLWSERIEDYKTSGLSAVKWAEDKGVSIHKLRYYIHKFNKEKKEGLNQDSKDIQWTSVAIEKEDSENKSNNPLKIIIGKATVEVADGFDEDTFKTVVKILSQC